MKLLLFPLLLLANTRFESIAYSTILLVLLIASGRITKTLIRSSMPIALSLVLIIPVIWQRIIRWDQPVLPEGVKLFSLADFTSNNKIFFDELFSLQPTAPIASLTCLLGLVGLILLLYNYSRFPAKYPSLPISVTLAIFMWILITSHFWSSPTDRMVERHYLPFCTFLSLLACYLFQQISKSWPKARPVILILIVPLTYWYFSIAQVRGAEKIGIFAARFELTKQFLKQPNSRPALVIGTFPNQYIAQGYAAVDFAYATNHLQELLKVSQANVVYVFQDIRVRTNQPTEETHLPPEFGLELISEQQYDYKDKPAQSRFLRISVLKAH